MERVRGDPVHLLHTYGTLPYSTVQCSLAANDDNVVIGGWQAQQPRPPLHQPGSDVALLAGCVRPDPRPLGRGQPSRHPVLRQPHLASWESLLGATT